MKRFINLIGATVAAMPLMVAAQTTTAPGGQAGTAVPSDATTATSTRKAHRGKRTKPSGATSTDRNTEPGVDADTAVTKGPSVANTGQTQPRGSTSDTPTKKAE